MKGLHVFIDPEELARTGYSAEYLQSMLPDELEELLEDQFNRDKYWLFDAVDMPGYAVVESLYNQGKLSRVMVHGDKLRF